jgi:hypothetical protein
MKAYSPILILALFTFAGLSGCQRDGPGKKNTADEQQTVAAQYGSIAIVPFTGDFGERWSGSVPKEKRKEYLENYLETQLPERLALEIARGAPSGSFKVISPAVVKEKRHMRDDLRALGKDVGAKLLLIGKAVPPLTFGATEGQGSIDFQLVVAETGELLWGICMEAGRVGDAHAIAERVLGRLSYAAHPKTVGKN